MANGLTLASTTFAGAVFGTSHYLNKYKYNNGTNQFNNLIGTTLCASLGSVGSYITVKNILFPLIKNLMHNINNCDKGNCIKNTNILIGSFGLIYSLYSLNNMRMQYAENVTLEHLISPACSLIDDIGYGSKPMYPANIE